MRRRPLALLLLAAFTVGLAIGPHPCWAESASAPGHPERSEGSGRGKAPAGHEAAPVAGHDCHGAAAEASADAPSDAPDDDAGTDRLLCERACQAVAVLGLPSLTLAVTPLAGLSAVQPASTVPLLVLSIDHVPLV